MGRLGIPRGQQHRAFLPRSLHMLPLQSAPAADPVSCFQPSGPCLRQRMQDSLRISSGSPHWAIVLHRQLPIALMSRRACHAVTKAIPGCKCYGKQPTACHACDTDGMRCVPLGAGRAQPLERPWRPTSRSPGPSSSLRSEDGCRCCWEACVNGDTLGWCTCGGACCRCCSCSAAIALVSSEGVPTKEPSGDSLASGRSCIALKRAFPA